MDQGAALDLARQGAEVGLMVLLPILAVSLFVGVLVSIFQALTQVQEATLTFVPKVAGIVAVLIGLGSWMLTSMVVFMQYSFQQISSVGHG